MTCQTKLWLPKITKRIGTRKIKKCGIRPHHYTYLRFDRMRLIYIRRLNDGVAIYGVSFCPFNGRWLCNGRRLDAGRRLFLTSWVARCRKFLWWDDATLAVAVNLLRSGFFLLDTSWIHFASFLFGIHFANGFLLADCSQAPTDTDADADATTGHRCCCSR